MLIQRKTSSYNDRRYGKPWIAEVIFPDSKGSFRFGDWTGQAGEEGLLEIEVEEGAIVARGQKDFRKPKNSMPDYYEVISGTLCPVSKSEAYLHYKDRMKSA